MKFWCRSVSLLATAFMLSPVFAEDAHHSKNYAGFFVGGTGETRRDRAITLGVEYERALTKRIRVGVVGEYAFGDEDFLIGIVPVSWNINGFGLYAGPGFEHKRGEETEFLGRVGARYAIEFEQYELAPQINFDWVDGDYVTVIGFSVVRTF